MAQEHNIHELMGWIWTALGVIGGGISYVGYKIWTLASKLTGYDKDIASINKTHDDDIEAIRNDIHEIRNAQQLKDAKFYEVLDKIDETKLYLAEENRKNIDNIREYFDKKYTTLEQRIYEQKK